MSDQQGGCQCPDPSSCACGRHPQFVQGSSRSLPPNYYYSYDVSGDEYHPPPSNSSTFSYQDARPASLAVSQSVPNPPTTAHAWPTHPAYYTYPPYPNPAAPNPAIPPIQRPVFPSESSVTVTDSRPPLSNSTSSVNNKQPAVPPRKRKRKQTAVPSSEPQQKRTRRPAREQEGVPGVGPPTAIDPQLIPPGSASTDTHRVDPIDPDQHRVYGSLVRRPRRDAARTTQASDVWYFMHALETKEGDVERPEVDPQASREKPSTAFVRCRLCALPKIWKCQNGQTKSIRKHLVKTHWKIYRDTVIDQRLKNWDKISKTSRDGPPANDGDDDTEELSDDEEPFTLDGFHGRLVDWIVSDDQSLHVVDNPLFRNVCLYLGRNKITEEDLPHRSKLTDLILRRLDIEHEQNSNNVKRALGRVSFTTDLWTDKILRSFMAITLHYCANDERGNLTIKSGLAAFRHIRGSHSGVHLAQNFLEVLMQLGILDKIGVITLDNASNCDTMVEELEYLLEEHGIPFHREGNRIRCFPHVVNISVQKGLRMLTQCDDNVYPDIDSNINISSSTWAQAASRAHAASDPGYVAALKDDAVGSARQLVNVCRNSGTKREDFQAVISEGNKTNAFGNILPPLELVRDIDTRWSSTFGMLDRMLDLYPVVRTFLEQPKQVDISHQDLTPHERAVIADVREFLNIPHCVQQILSFERTPTAPLVLPAYENLLELLRLGCKKLPKIAHAISASAEVLEDYLKKSRKTRVYSLAMVINPTTKFAWLETHWSSDECRQAHEWMRNVMLEYRKAARVSVATSAVNTCADHSQPASSNHVGLSSASSTRAAQMQRAGFSRLDDLRKSLSSGNESELNGQAGAASCDSDVPDSDEARADAERRALEQDKIAVDEELHQYKTAGLIGLTANLAGVDLLRYWQRHQSDYPVIYRVALDILPVQASAVPSERIFSSSKETDTLRRSRMGPQLMEVLQMVKYSVRQDRLTFTEDWLTSEEEGMRIDDLSAGDVPTGEVNRLLSTRNIDDLYRLVTDM